MRETRNLTGWWKEFHSLTSFDSVRSVLGKPKKEQEKKFSQITGIGDHCILRLRDLFTERQCSPALSSLVQQCGDTVAHDLAGQSTMTDRMLTYHLLAAEVLSHLTEPHIEETITEPFTLADIHEKSWKDWALYSLAMSSVDHISHLPQPLSGKTHPSVRNSMVIHRQLWRMLSGMDMQQSHREGIQELLDSEKMQYYQLEDLRAWSTTSYAQDLIGRYFLIGLAAFRSKVKTLLDAIEYLTTIKKHRESMRAMITILLEVEGS